MSLELGPCSVAFGTAGGETDLGKTHGGVTVRISDDSVDLKSDQSGTSPEDTVITGTTVEVELALAEITMARLATALGQTAFGSDTGVPGENKVGYSMADNAQSLLLKKYVDGIESTDAADQIRFPAACPMSDIELSYDAENQRVLKVKFKCFKTTVSANWGTSGSINKEVFYIFGDETATS